MSIETIEWEAVDQKWSRKKKEKMAPTILTNILEPHDMGG